LFNQLSVLLGFAAGATHLIAYWVYIRTSSEKINTGSWTLWVLGGIVELSSYFFLTHDATKNILPIACAMGAVVTYGYAHVRKQFEPLTSEDKFFIGIDVGITLFWFLSSSALAANLLYVGSSILSFIPMLLGLARNKEQEQPLPWLIWSIAYLLFTVSVAMRLNRPEELVYPISCLVLHISVFVIAFMKQRPAR
jgi:hypothetical protein